MMERSGRRLWRWMRLAVTGIALAVLLGTIDLSHALAIARGARPDLLALAALIVVAERVLAAYRWYILLHGKHEQITFGAVLRLVFISGFVGFLTPGGVGVEVVRIHGLSRATSDLALAVSSVLVERLQGLLALVLLVLFGVALGPAGLPPSIGRAAWLGLALMIAGLAMLMHPRVRALVDLLLPGAMLAPVRSRLAKLYYCLDDYKERPGLMAWGMVVAIAFQVGRIAFTVTVARALGLEAPIMQFAVFMPVIFFLSQLPISIAGLGVREAGFVYLFGFVGVSPAAAFALSLLSFCLHIAATAIPGAWCCAWKPKR